MMCVDDLHLDSIETIIYTQVNYIVRGTQKYIFVKGHGDWMADPATDCEIRLWNMLYSLIARGPK